MGGDPPGDSFCDQLFRTDAALVVLGCDASVYVCD
jgi:hypothetical protein